MVVTAVTGGGKKWEPRLENVAGQDVGTTVLGNNNAKPFVNATFLVNGPSAPKAGTWNLSSPVIPSGPLLQAHVNRKTELRKEKASEERFKKFESKQGSPSSSNTDGSAPTPKHGQDDILARLAKLHGERKQQRKGEGHPTIKMIKIRLVKPLTASVGGEDRVITHLYTQGGNENELRCYVGNAEGAYQRVHTSITKGGQKTSHTMVQTGEAIAIPGAIDAPRATRIGFNAQEGQTPGYANRTLTERDKDDSTVKNKSRVGDIQGQAHRAHTESVGGQHAPGRALQPTAGPCPRRHTTLTATAWTRARSWRWTSSTPSPTSRVGR